MSMFQIRCQNWHFCAKEHEQPIVILKTNQNAIMKGADKGGEVDVTRPNHYIKKM